MLKPTYHYYIFFTLILFVLLGLFFRIYKFSQVPGSMYVDEVSIASEARFLADTKMDLHQEKAFKPIYFAYGDYKLAVYLILAGVSAFFLGISELSVRLPSLLAGISTLLVAYFFAREMILQKILTLKVSSSKNFDTKTIATYFALSFASVLALSPSLIIFARTGFEGNLAQFFLNLSILVFLLANKDSLFDFVLSKKISWALVFLSALIGSLSIYTYFANRFVWPVAILVVWLMIGTKRSFIKLAFALSIAFSLVGFMYFSEYYQANNLIRYSADSILSKKDEYAITSNIWREKSGNTPITRILYHRHIFMLKDLAHNYSENLSLKTLFFMADENLCHSTGEHGMFLSAMLIFFLLGIIELKNHRRVALALIIWILAASLPASVPLEVPHALRSLNVVFAVGLIIALGFLRLILSTASTQNSSKKTLIDKLGFIFLSLFLWVMIMLQTLHFGHFYFKVYPTISANAWSLPEKQLVEAILKYRLQKEPVLILSSADKLHLWILSYYQSYINVQNLSIDKKDRHFSMIDGIYFNPSQPLVTQIIQENEQILIISTPDQMQDLQKREYLIDQDLQKEKYLVDQDSEKGAYLVDQDFKTKEESFDQSLQKPNYEHNQGSSKTKVEKIDSAGAHYYIYRIYKNYRDF